MSDELRFEYVSSDTICKALEVYGPGARIGLIEQPRYTQRMAERDVWAMPPQGIRNAVDLAVLRIRELEARLKASSEWLLETLNLAVKTPPGKVTPDCPSGPMHEGAWRLLCEHSREIHGRTIDRLADRAHELEEEERERDPYGRGRM